MEKEVREAVRAGRDEQIRKRKGRKNKRHRTTEKIKEEKRKKTKKKDIMDILSFFTYDKISCQTRKTKGRSTEEAERE